MLFHMNRFAGQPVYVQLMQQIRHAIATGVLQLGDQLPGIRTLAQELVVSHNTVAKAYITLEQEGLLDLRHGSGAFISAKRRSKSRADTLRQASDRVRELVGSLLNDGITIEEIHGMIEAELFYPVGEGEVPER